jgi:hypothetical protein
MSNKLETSARYALSCNVRTPRSVRLSFFLFALCLFVFLNAVPVHAESWSTYGNDRYGYELCYPPSLLAAQPESDAGDGRAFLGRNGEKLLVWGAFDSPHKSPAAILQSLKSRVESPGSLITYQTMNSHAATLSGMDGSNIFYSHAFVDKRGGVDSFLLIYPKNESNIFDAVAGRIARCFKTF